MVNNRMYLNWAPENVEQESGEWLSSAFNRERNFEVPTKRIEERLAESDTTPSNLGGSIGRSLELLSRWYTTVAEFDISRGKPEGWAELKRALRYEYWSIRTLVRLWELDNRRTKQPRVLLQQASLYYALAVTLDAEIESEWLGARISRAREDEAFGSWKYECLPAFLLTLYLRSKNDSRTVIAPEPDGLGVYAGILDCWEDLKGLESAIRKAADYHIDHTRESDEEIMEFAMNPFVHVPVELLALEKIRKRLGLETPRIDHPIFSTPFCEPPTFIDDIDDSLLDRVSAYVLDAIDA